MKCKVQLFVFESIFVMSISNECNQTGTSIVLYVDVFVCVGSVDEAENKSGL